MLYFTIIIVTAIIAICFVLYKYIGCVYNPNIYASENVSQAKYIIKKELARCNKYNTAEGDVRYNYSYSQKEINDIFTNLALVLDINIEDYE